MMTPRTSLVLTSRLESLQQLEGFINKVMKRNRLDQDMRGNVMISTLEAVTNAIRHGNGLGSDKEVRVNVFERPDRLQIVVRDQGAGFSPDEVADPTDPEFLLREGGRGVFLIQSLADQCDYEDDGRTVRMTFVCDAPAEADASMPDAAIA